MSPSCFVVDAVRTPIGRLRGALKDVRPDDLAALVLKALVSRNALEPASVDEVFLGCANQAGEDNRNVARMALLLAGLPHSVPGATINRLCGSGLEAIIQGARMIRLGEAEIVIAAGVESMTRAPWSVAKPSEAYPGGKIESYDTSLGWRYPNPRLAAMFPLEQMGETAENVAAQFNVSRDDQDAFAAQSHQRALAAMKAGHFKDELVPVEVAASKKGSPSVVIAEDEGPRADSSIEKLRTLNPVFREGGTVTAGNSSSLNDGASAVLLMSERALAGRASLGRFISSAATGVDPRVMGIGPVSASRKALERAAWARDSVDLIELNEAFASQSLACLRELKLDPAQVNVNGGAIALGHPLGMSGARIVTTLLHAMKARSAKRGLASMCIGVGQGIAATFETGTP